MNIIELQDVHVTFHERHKTVEAVRGVSLKIEQGEIFGIVGFSGAGKSTLVRTINLLERPTQGRVLIDGKDITAATGDELRKLRRNIGFVFQSFNLIDNITVGANIAFALKAGGVDKAAWHDRTVELLKLVGLDSKIDSYPSSLSGGQKQRVAIAGVIAMQPKIIVLDEPTAMLDPQGRAEVVSTVSKLCREKGMTVILITHHMDECVDADRLIVMSNGHIVADGSPEKVFSMVELMEKEGLTVPETTRVLYELRGQGIDVPLDALRVEDCARAIAAEIG